MLGKSFRRGTSKESGRVGEHVSATCSVLTRRVSKTTRAMDTAPTLPAETLMCRSTPHALPRCGASARRTTIFERCGLNGQPPKRSGEGRT